MAQTPAYQTASFQDVKFPRIVIEINFGTDAVPDKIFFTTHSDSALPDGVSVSNGNVLLSTVMDFGSISQTLDVKNNSSTIGIATIKLLDKNKAVSQLFQSKQIDLKGLNKKQVRIYSGFVDLEWADYYNISSPIISNRIKFKDNVYTISCGDIQRTMVKDIFDSKAVTTNIINQLDTPLITSLTNTINSTATILIVVSTSNFPTSGKLIIDNEIVSYSGTTVNTFTGLVRGVLGSVAISHLQDSSTTKVYDSITVGDTTEFELLEHDESYITDAPNMEVGYFSIKKAIYRYHSKTSNSFIDVVPNVLASKAILVEVDSNADDDKKPKVVEVVYIQGPVLKVALAILQGSIYGQPGKSYPKGWNLGISGAFIETSSFINQPDLWNLNDNLAGRQCRFIYLNSKKVKGKKFLNEQIMSLASGYYRIEGDGQLAFRRLVELLSDAPYIAVIDKTNIKTEGYSDLVHDLGELINRISINWNFNHLDNTHTRTNNSIDSGSITVNGESEIYTKSYDGLFGGTSGTEIISNISDNIRSRFSGIPEKLTLTCVGSMNFLQVGDIVRVQGDFISDFSKASSHTISIDRSFEIQSVTINHIANTVVFVLFGSTRKASAIKTGSQLPVLADSFYPSDGAIDLGTYGGITSSGAGTGTLTITGGELTGNADLSVGGVYYYDGNVIFQNGTLTKFTENVMLRIKGSVFFEGAILDGRGAGQQGGVAVSDSTPSSINPGAIGFAGYTISMGGVTIRPDNHIASFPGRGIGAYNAGLPALQLINNTTSISGLPTDFRSCSGSSGGGVYQPAAQPGYTARGGAAGGNSGAALIFICRGFDGGIDGNILTSGTDGLLGNLGVLSDALPFTNVFDTWEYRFLDARAGSGAGGAASPLYVFLDGGNSIIGSIGLIAIDGLSPTSGIKLNRSNELIVNHQSGWARPVYSYHDSGNTARVDRSITMFKIDYIKSDETAQEDVPEETVKPNVIQVVELQNTPEVLSGGLSTLEILVPKPADITNYSYANVYAKRTTDELYTLVGSSDGTQEALGQVIMDGATYEIIAKGVSITGNETENFADIDYTVANTFGGVNQGVGNYLGAGKTSFTDTTPGYFLERTALGGRAIFGGLTDSVIIDDQGNVTITGKLEASSGKIGGFNITETTIEDLPQTLIMDSFNSRIRVLNGGNYVEMSATGFRGVDTVLGTTVNIPIDGTPPSFSSGIINNTVFNITTAGILETSESAGDGSASSAGVRINDIGIRGWGANQTTPNFFLDAASGNLQAANANLTGNGRLTINSDIFGSSGIQFEYNSGTPRAYIGNGANNFMRFESGVLTLGPDVVLNVTDADIVSVSASKITSGFISAADIEIQASGVIHSQNLTAFETGVGFRLDDVGGAGRFNVGDYNTFKYMTFDSNGLKLGRNTQLLGADAFANKSIYYHIYFESFDSMQASSTNGATQELSSGYARLTLGTPSNSAIGLNRNLYEPIEPHSFNKDRRLLTKVAVNDSVGGTGDFHWSIGTRGFFGGVVQSIGFHWTGMALYGQTLNPTEALTFLLNVNSQQFYKLLVEFDAGIEIRYYVDDVLLGTSTTNLPSGDNLESNSIFSINGSNLAAVTVGSRFRISELKVEQGE